LCLTTGEILKRGGKRGGVAVSKSEMLFY